jgi:hypothetical protein
MPKGPASQEGRGCKEESSGQKGVAKELGLAPSTLEFRIKRPGIDNFQYWNKVGLWL